jgi:lipid-A-disaccharide synthase
MGRSAAPSGSVVLISAGDPSGDLHAAELAAQLGVLRPDLSLAGVGGRRMQAAGVTLLEDLASRAVMGFAEIVRHLPRHARVVRRLAARMRRGDIALLICVDYGGMNLRVADAAHRAGVPVLYYITPQVWASRPGRMVAMARTVTKAAVILPFEEALLRANGIDATFVGHPLLDELGTLPSPAAARAALGLAADGPLLALFPGSRAQEVGRLLAPFVAAARQLEQRIPSLSVVVSQAPGVRLDPAICPYPAVTGSSAQLLRAATAALCKSGTTTLEAAIVGCPLVVAYRTSGWTFAIARRVVTIDRIGLVNVVASRMQTAGAVEPARLVAPEFVQDAVVPAALADALLPLLDVGSPVRARAVADLDAVRRTLGTPGAAGRVARMASALAGTPS